MIKEIVIKTKCNKTKDKSSRNYSYLNILMANELQHIWYYVDNTTYTDSNRYQYKRAKLITAKTYPKKWAKLIQIMNNAEEGKYNNNNRIEIEIIK